MAASNLRMGCGRSVKDPVGCLPIARRMDSSVSMTSSTRFASRIQSYVVIWFCRYSCGNGGVGIRMHPTDKAKLMTSTSKRRTLSYTNWHLCPGFDGSGGDQMATGFEPVTGRYCHSRTVRRGFARFQKVQQNG